MEGGMDKVIEEMKKDAEKAPETPERILSDAVGVEYVDDGTAGAVDAG